MVIAAQPRGDLGTETEPFDPEDAWEGFDDLTAEQQAALQARAGAWAVRDEVTQSCKVRAKRREGHPFFSGRRSTGRKWRSGFGPAPEAGAA